ncbi:MAG: hypothetical protein ACRED0_10635 [Gammaproteobacteria bacterium]
MGLHAEAFDYEGARGYCLEALQTMRKDRDLYTAFLGQILLGRAYLGLLDYPRAWECFHAVSNMIDQEHLIMDWNFYLPLRESLGEYWLAKGDCERARDEAQRLCELAAWPPDNAHWALGHRLLAEVAIAGCSFDEAKAQVAQALAIVQGDQLSLAAWRVYATAASLHQRLGRQPRPRLSPRGCSSAQSARRHVPQGRSVAALAARPSAAAGLVPKESFIAWNWACQDVLQGIQSHANIQYSTALLCNAVFPAIT